MENEKETKKKNNHNLAFWIVTGLCIVSLILSPVLAYIKKSPVLGGCIFGVSILLWLCMIVLNETKKHK